MVTPALSIVRDPADDPQTLARLPLPTGSSTPEVLRAELAAAIEARRAADARAGKAIEIADRADAILHDARSEVARLEADQREAERLTTEDRARAISAALRAGSELPAPSPPPMADPAPLTRAMATSRAIEAAAADLFADREAARNEAAAATGACRALVDQILTIEGRALATEWIAAVRTSWMLQDRLTGLARIGDGALLPHAFQTQILNQIERRRCAVSENAIMIEKHNFDGYLDRLSAAEERRWRDYGARLMEDAGATFECAEFAQ